MSADLTTAQRRMLEEVLEGLQQPRKRLPSKYFYDERGSELFEKITSLPEYYPTRTEKEILTSNILEITECIGEDAVLVELGSGSSTKTRLLLDHLRELSAYIPVDISKGYLLETVRSLKKEYPGLFIKPVCADYTTSFQIPDIPHSFEYYVYFYPGSTIGNFHPGEARSFLKTISRRLVPGGGLLIGVDLKKDVDTLERAYNDAQGVTAEFNKNLLVRLNRELNADFDLEQFSHRAFYNKQKGRIEMHLESSMEQNVCLNGQSITISKEETIHTENSYKYSLRDIEELVDEWFRVDRVWIDEEELFSLQYLRKK